MIENEGIALANNLLVAQAAPSVEPHVGVDGVLPISDSVISGEKDEVSREFHIIERDGKFIKLDPATGVETEVPAMEYYKHLAQEIKSMSGDNEEIMAMTDENLAKDLFLHDHPEVKKKMVEAAAAVNAYTNTAISPPEANPPAMDLAASKVLEEAMTKTSIAEIYDIDPVKAATAAIEQKYPEKIYDGLEDDVRGIWEFADQEGHKNIAMSVEKGLRGKDSFGNKFTLEDTSHANKISPTETITAKVPVKGTIELT